MVPDCAVNRQELGCAQVILENRLRIISTGEALDRMLELLELTLPIRYIHNFIDNKDRGLMKNKPIGSRIRLTLPEVYCIDKIGQYYSFLGDYMQAEYYINFLYEYFDFYMKAGIHTCKMNIYVDLAKTYSSLCGNMRQYAKSDYIADEAAARQLMERRLDGIWWHKYNNIWNADMQQQDTEKYITGVKECIFLCQICRAESAEREFKKAVTKR